MKCCLKVEVSLKRGYTDPEGETTARLLRELGYKVENVNVSKVYTVILEAGSREEALEKADEMCRRLLANPTKDDYTIKLVEEKL
ncbi:MAG: phosphoribosylformylglycinamidine synthase subunit PurS [Candidatus Bathyarchaeia archaeon]